MNAVSLTHPNSSWSGLVRSDSVRTPPTMGDARPFAVAKGDGRLKTAHDEIVSDFKRIKIYSEMIFLFQNSYLYRADDLERPHASHLSDHRGGARAHAREYEIQKSKKSDEQFCCRRTQSRQSEGRRSAARQPQRAASGFALGRSSRPTPACSSVDQKFLRTVRTHTCIAPRSSCNGRRI